MVAAQQVRLVRGRIPGASLPHGAVGRRERELKRGNGGPCNCVLDGEDLRRLSVEPLRPEPFTIRHPEHLGSDPELIAGALYAPREDMSHADLPTDRSQIVALVPHGECGGTGGHLQAGHIGESIGECFGDAIAHVRVGVISAQVGKGKNGNRRGGVSVAPPRSRCTPPPEPGQNQDNSHNDGDPCAWALPDRRAGTRQLDGHCVGGTRRIGKCRPKLRHRGKAIRWNLRERCHHRSLDARRDGIPEHAE